MCLLFVGWLVWLYAARISVFEVSNLARLEMDRAVDSIESEVAGRVVSVQMVVDQEVEAGELLVQLETLAQEAALAELSARRDSLAQQLVSLAEELALQDEVLAERLRAGRLWIAEERKLLETTGAALDLAETDAGVARRLHDDGQLATIELSRRLLEAAQLRARAEAQRVALDRLESEQRGLELQSRIDLAQRQSSMARLKGQLAETDAKLERTRVEIEKRSIRAPRAGRVGEVKPLTPSMLVRQGEQLGAILATGKIRLVGEFVPASALGRVQVGQRAQARLDGFPWTQYGMLGATVRRVASEPRDGHLRVELDVDPTSRIPLQHGLSGTVEVEVERISPAALLLRSLGKRFDTGTASAGQGPAR